MEIAGIKVDATSAIERSVLRWCELNSPDSCFLNEDWTSSQFISSLDHGSDALSEIVSSSADCNRQSSGCAVPSLTSLHIAVSKGRIDIVDQLIKANCNIDIMDQYGFTALHYAVVKRNTDIILLLTASGACATSNSKEGSTPLDLAKALKFKDIEDILSSKIMTEADPSLPKFREWLCHLGAGEYVSKFLAAGYDMPFIARTGLVDADLDCVGIPMSKLGIRKKILALHNLKNFYQIEEAGEEEEEEEEESERESEDDSYNESENEEDDNNST